MEELTKKFEKLMLANEGGDDVTMLDYGVEQQGMVKQGEDDTNRTTHRQEMAEWLVEMAVKEATQREELTKKFEKLMLAIEGGDDVTMLDYGVQQQGMVKQGEDDTTMSWEEVLGTSDQVQKPGKQSRSTARVRKVSVREVKYSESEYFTAFGQYKARTLLHVSAQELARSYI